MSLIVPEFIIHKTLTGLLKFVRDDYTTQVDKTQSYLYKVLNGVSFERYNLYEQAVKVICGPEDEPRRMRLDLMFNMKQDGMPTVSIQLPAETTHVAGNGLGTDEGYEEDLFTDGDQTNGIPGTRIPVLTRRYQAQYDIVVTSDNTNEVILLYHFIKALLTAAIAHFHLSGLQNVQLGGMDVQMKELANRVYMRSIRMSLQYDTSVPTIPIQPMPHQIEVDTGTPELEFD